MHILIKFAIASLWVWDVVVISTETVGTAFDMPWLSSSAIPLMVAPLWSVAVAALFVFPKRKSRLNFEREMFPELAFRPTFRD